MMPTTAIQPPLSLPGWLLQDPDPTESAGQAIAEPLQASSSRILAQLGRISRASLGRQIIDAFREVLPDDLVDVFGKAWGDYRRLVEVGADSARQPPAQRIVKLTQQEVRFEQESSLAVVINKKAVLDLTGRVEVVFTLSEAEAIVRMGRLFRVHAQQFSMSGKIEVEGQQIVHKEWPWPHEFLIEFDPGVDLTRSAFRPAAPQYQ